MMVVLMEVLWTTKQSDLHLISSPDLLLPVKVRSPMGVLLVRKEGRGRPHVIHCKPPKSAKIGLTGSERTLAQSVLIEKAVVKMQGLDSGVTGKGTFRGLEDPPSSPSPLLSLSPKKVGVTSLLYCFLFGFFFCLLLQLCLTHQLPPIADLHQKKISQDHSLWSQTEWGRSLQTCTSIHFGVQNTKFDYTGDDFFIL